MVTGIYTNRSEGRTPVKALITICANSHGLLFVFSGSGLGF